MLPHNSRYFLAQTASDTAVIVLLPIAGLACMGVTALTLYAQSSLQRLAEHTLANSKAASP